MGPQRIQDMKGKESVQSSVHSTSPCTASSPLWWNATSAQITQSSLSKSLNLKDSKIQHIHGKLLDLQLQDQDSSSTQRTVQSFHGVVGTGGGKPHGQFITAQLGFKEIYGWQGDGQTKMAYSLRTPNLAIPASQVDYSSPVTHIPYTYAEPYFGGVLAAYGPQAVIHPPLLAMTPGRVPLPLDLAEGPIYVNAKQYHGILRRRQARAKLGVQNKLVKGQKMYLHESRHQHALNRVRGPGGRFLNTKLQQPKPPSTSAGQHDLDSAPHQLRGNILKSEVLQSENGNMGASAACSEITSISNDDDMFEQPDFGFTSAFRSHMGGSLQGGGGGIIRNGPDHRA